MLSKNISKILYWQAEKLRGRLGVKERLAWLIHNQGLSALELKTIQLEKLQAIIRHAYSTVPFYTELFQAHNLHPNNIQDESDLVKIPLLTREILLKNQDKLISSKADFATLKNNYSSGSTGARAVFKQDKNFRLWMRAHQIRTYQWCHNWELGERFVLLWGSEIYWSMRSLQDKLINFISNRREFNTFKLTARLINDFTQTLQKYAPVLISSYSNALYLIALEIKKMGMTIPALRAVQTTSEPLPPAMRERVQHAFQCEVFDKYGCRETNIVSHESPAHDGMLIQSENVVVEFRNKEGNACKNNEIGNVLLTTLNNYSMPLIRYETSDLASPLSGLSQNGFPFPRMSEVSGREQDLIYTPNGNYIDSYFFSYLFMRFENIHWFQVIQPQYESLIIRLLAPLGFDLSTKKEMIDRIHHHTGYPFEIQFDVITEMPASNTGKFKLCISQVKEAVSVKKGIAGADL